MSNYYTSEAPVDLDEAVLRKRQETSVKDQLDEITKKLYEANLALKAIIHNLIGYEGDEDQLLNEEKCMRDTVLTVHKLADGCMGMSHRISDLLF